jgi:hypothetical protein
MTINGEKREYMELTQWEAVAMHDFPLSAEKSGQRSEELRESLGKLASLDTEDYRIQPLTDSRGNSYELSPREWADTLGRRAVAMQGISYAGEMPTRSKPQPRSSTFPTLP